jgi:hypothetical protein
MGLSSAQVSKTLTKRHLTPLPPVISGLLRGQVVTEVVETKPYAPALKGGWMYIHGLNRVTKQDCWLRRFPHPT